MSRNEDSPEDSALLSLFDLGREVIAQTVEPGQAIERLQSLPVLTNSLPSLLFDATSLLESFLKSAPDPEEARKKFIEFIDLVKKKYICEDVLNPELDVLEAQLPDNKTQIVRLKTKLFYKQSKFNLLREESEGYAKLITELLEINGQWNGLGVDDVINRMLCLIGQFNLDPNRVTDIIIECFECASSPQDRLFFTKLLKKIDVVPAYICNILGFKFSVCQGQGRETPFALYTVAAYLIHFHIIQMLDLLGFMMPKADGIKETHKARAANATARISKAETISTASIPIDSKSSSLFDSLSESIVSSSNTSIQGVSLATVAAIQEMEDQKIADPFLEEKVLSSNQKLGLLCALLELKNWKYAQMLLDRLPEFYATILSVRVCRALADMIDDSIHDFYMQKCDRRLPGLPQSVRESPVEPDENSLSKVNSWTELIAFSNVLSYLGPRIGYSARTLTKLVRLVTVFYEEHKKGIVSCSQTDLNSMMDIIDEFLLPSLSLAEMNSALSEELWTLLQGFTYEIRYRLYGRWNSHTARYSEIGVVRAKVIGRTKYVLKRLSKDTVRIMGRQLGKLAHLHPMAMFDYLLSQVQTFDNLIGPVVDSIRFLTSLEFDVLSFCIISQLSNPSKQQLKASDATLSPWLIALANLVGSIYKKYPMELNGMLEYVAHQLRNSKSFDLLLVREIIQNMSWVESSTGLTNEQVEALSGGEVLKQEAGGFSTARNKRASVRLKDALLKDNLAVSLCILIAQQREFIVHEDGQTLPLKLVGEMMDQCRDTLQQLVAFLLSYVKWDDYAKRMPTVGELLTEFRLPLDAAMFLVRPTYMPKVLAMYDAAKRAKPLEEGKTRLDSAQKMIVFKEVLDTFLDELSQDLSPCLSPHIINDVASRQMAIFWMLNLYDIEVPVAAYERTLEAVRKQLKDVTDNIDMSKSKRAKEEERLKSLEAKLKDEQKRQTEHVARIREHQQTAAFFQMCVYSRALFSEVDAIYCGRLFIYLHEQRTTFFMSVLFVDKIFSDVLPLICGLTENEAASYGRFLDIILTQCNKWHASKQLYEAECAGTPGFIVKKSDSPGEGQGLVYENFRKLSYKWQQTLQMTFQGILSDPKAEYALLRNSLIVMTKMINSFPTISEHLAIIEKEVGKVRDREKGSRDDLSLKAASYAGRLRLRAIKTIDTANYCIQSRKVKPAAAAGKKKENKESKEAKEGKESKDSKETKESNANSNEEKETVNGKSTKEEKRTAAKDKKKLTSSNESLNNDEKPAKLAKEIPKEAGPQPPPTPKASKEENNKDKDKEKTATKDRKRSAPVTENNDEKPAKAAKESSKESAPPTPTARMSKEESSREKEREREKDKEKEKPALKERRRTIGSNENHDDKSTKLSREASKELAEKVAGPKPPKEENGKEKPLTKERKRIAVPHESVLAYLQPDSRKKKRTESADEEVKQSSSSTENGEEYGPSRHKERKDESKKTSEKDRDAQRKDKDKDKDRVEHTPVDREKRDRREKEKEKDRRSRSHDKDKDRGKEKERERERDRKKETERHKKDEKERDKRQEEKLEKRTRSSDSGKK
ncbi:hypothetical protein WR25_19360 [Diploscapter pachys]|uniref:THO complex subunit 2 n=1 Tax=Diploscapter pachys TaxID=2018661 RepID=A0A2A2L6J6_9BILA|nr:hypothetical protein WR25_19360 [Diploscapter pachys]